MQEKIIVYTDGGSRGNPGIAGAGVYMTDAADQEIYREFKYLDIKTNNEAEYLALNLAISYLKQTIKTPTSIVFKLDSKLVVEQMSKKWQIKEARLRELATANWQLLATIPHCSYQFVHIPREQNKVADSLANQAMDLA